jgi:RNA polymerase sigma factor (sigma-70 family)
VDGFGPHNDAARSEAAVTLLASHGRAFRRTALRWSLCADDADDALQRATEILLTKAPPLEAPRLAAWMHVVTRREAFAVRRARERLLAVAPGNSAGGGDPLDGFVGDFPTPAEWAERRERVRDAVGALAALKPHERLAIVLQAHGYSYAEIASRCGWTYTKVNRCLAEGREALRRS